MVSYDIILPILVKFNSLVFLLSYKLNFISSSKFLILFCLVSMRSFKDIVLEDGGGTKLPYSSSAACEVANVLAEGVPISFENLVVSDPLVSPLF